MNHVWFHSGNCTFTCIIHWVYLTLCVHILHLCKVLGIFKPHLHKYKDLCERYLNNVLFKEATTQLFIRSCVI